MQTVGKKRREKRFIMRKKIPLEKLSKFIENLLK